MRQDGISLESKDTGSSINYGYICVFLMQLFVLILCGTYINTAILCISWSIILLSTHEHNVIICMLCAISIVLQTYVLSINSQHILLISSPRQKACETIGISSIESLYRRNNVFKSCNADLLVPFIPNKKYTLQEDPTIKLMYGRHTTLNKLTVDNFIEEPMRITTCHALGLSCFRWKIQIQGFNTRFFEPCWSLVRNVFANNASTIHMMHQPINMPQTHMLNVSLPSGQHTNVIESRFLHIVSDIHNPIALADTAFLDTKELSSVPYAPDSDTFFVLVPNHANQKVSMQVALSIRCSAHDRDTSKLTDDEPFFHSGVIHLTSAANPTVYTVYSAFSDCVDGMGGCNSRLLTSFLVYICNIALCLSCIGLTHCCIGFSVNEYSVMHIFAMGMAFVTFNWVAIVCIYFVHPASLHGGIANLNRHTQVFFYILHSVQFLLLAVELSRNELGNNTQYILSRMHTKYSAEQLLLPFTMLDNNIYIENCTLYLISSLFVTYLLYFKTGV